MWAEHFDDDPALDPPGAPLNGDYNNDGVVDGLDYVVWAENFEASIFAEPSASAAALVSTAGADVVRANAVSTGAARAVDAAFELEYVEPASAATMPTADRNALVTRWQLRRAFAAALETTRGDGRSAD
ncbi:MAG: hypothetical protein R3C10_17050 [Pirellulales bacterium]